MKYKIKEATVGIERFYIINSLLNGAAVVGDKEITHTQSPINNYDGYEVPQKLIRHKTNKEKWLIKTNNTHLLCTNDHSVMDCDMNEVKPSNIKIGDFIIVNGVKTNVEYCKQIGAFNDEYVYDIEMQDNKTFYANNILVHNTDSVYFSMEDLITDVVSRNLLPEKYSNDLVDFITDFVDFRLNGYIDTKYNEFAARFNSDNIQKFEMETLMYDAILLAKKKYVGLLAWKEGAGKITRDAQKLKITGVEIVQSSTPKFCRDTLKEMVGYIFKNIDNFSIADFINKLNVIKQNFKTQPIENISISKSVGDYEKFIIEDKQVFKIASGCPIHIRGAGYHNHLLYADKTNGNKYKKLKTGDKLKFYHALDDVCNVFSYNAGDHPYEIAPEVNIDLQFEKTIIDPLNRLILPMGYPRITPQLVTHKALF